MFVEEFNHKGHKEGMHKVHKAKAQYIFVLPFV
jgi:hypothetical protein